MPKRDPVDLDDVRLVTCSLCLKDCLGESMRIHRRQWLPVEVRKLAYIALRLHDKPRCETCITEDYKRACRESDLAAKTPSKWGNAERTVHLSRETRKSVEGE